MSYSQQLPGSDLVLARSAGRPAAAGEALLRRGLLLAYAAQGHWPWLGTQLRRSVLLVWWTCTLQIHTHLRQWLRARCRPAKTPAANDPLLLDAPAAHSISVPCAPRPRVSVIVPTFGKVEFTLRCLASIAAHPPVAAIEVIVVDDAFPGPETACLRNVAGIRLLRNQANLGYLRACNSAALQASGEYLLFLNNDTQVQPGWLDSMLEIFATHGAVGAVGSQLLSPDGRLQEAGGIIWRDGSGWNYGRGDDPTRPQYNYVREVDYCSGASMMVPRMLFQRISGFDERYAPAYYEDTDLCFRLRALGLKTMYQPRSRVVHFDGVSHGRDPSAGVKAFQEENRKTFLRIWPHILARENFENGIQVMRARDRAARRSMALVIDHKMPEADRDAGSRAILCVIRALQADGMVVKFWPANLQYVPKYTEALQDMGVEVFYGPDQAPLAAWLREHGSTLDLVVLSRPDVAEHSLDAVQASSSARIVYYGHDLHHRRMAMQAKVTGDLPLLLEAQRMEQRERSIWRRVDRVLYLSEEEAAEVRGLESSADVRAVVPYCFERFAPARVPPPGMDIVFVAGFAHPPNEDAACWFMREVLGKVRMKHPGATLSIVGSQPTARVRSLAGNGVTVLADVDDAKLLEVYRRARVAVVPLRWGAGVKLKVVEALREGVPLVTTPVGAQGLPGVCDVAFVRDTAESFARAVCELLSDDTVWKRCCAKQIEYAVARFNKSALQESIMNALLPQGGVSHSAGRTGAEHRASTPAGISA